MEIFADSGYKLLTMQNHNSSAHLDQSDDERIEREEDEDEFSTYFTDQKVDIPEDDKVLNSIINHLLNDDVS